MIKWNINWIYYSQKNINTKLGDHYLALDLLIIYSYVLSLDPFKEWLGKENETSVFCTKIL